MASTLALVLVILQSRLQFSNVSSFRLFHTDRITGFLSSKIKHWNTTLQQRVIPVKLLLSKLYCSKSSSMLDKVQISSLLTFNFQIQMVFFAPWLFDFDDTTWSSLNYCWSRHVTSMPMQWQSWYIYLINITSMIAIWSTKSSLETWKHFVTKLNFSWKHVENKLARATRIEMSQSNI